MHDGESENLPESINTAGLKVLYNNLDENEELALSLHENLKNNAPDGWREHSPSQNRVKGLILKLSTIRIWSSNYTNSLSTRWSTDEHYSVGQ